MAKIGDLIKSTDDAYATSQASHDAAVAADQKATADQTTYEASQAKLAGAIKKVGPITVANSDGTFTTYEASTTDPGYRVEVSKGVDAEVDDVSPEPTPAPVTPPPTPDPTPVVPPVQPVTPTVTPTPPPTPAPDSGALTLPPAQLS